MNGSEKVIDKTRKRTETKTSVAFRRVLEQLSAAEAIGRRLTPRGTRLLRWLRRRYAGGWLV